MLIMGIAFTLYFIYVIGTVELKLLAEFPVEIQSSSIEKIPMLLEIYGELDSFN